MIKLPDGIKSLEQLNISSYSDDLGVKLLDNLQFDKTNKISINLTEDQKDFYKYENYLYLIFQVRNDNNSSFVVLEGDYSTKNTIVITGMSSKEESPISLIYKPELVKMNDNFSYAYSNDLILYLLHNVITNKDIIGENISYVKNLLKFTNTVNYWSNNIKYSAYVKYLLPSKKIEDDYSQQDWSKCRKNCKNVTGFIDTQIEEYLNANSI